MSLVNKDSFISSFLIWIPFVSFYCLITLTRTSSTMLKWSGEKEHHCSVPVLSGGGLVTKLCLTLVAPWTVACQALLPMGFSRQEYWSGLPLPSPGDLPDPGIEHRSLALQTDSCLITLTRTCSTMLKWSGETEHHCLVPNPNRKLQLSQNWIWY